VNCLLNGYYKALKLRTNIRAHLSKNNDDDFPHLLKLREGKILSSHTNSDEIHLDNRSGHIVHILSQLIDAIYPEIDNLLQRDYHWVYTRAIVSPINNTVNEINDFILLKFPDQIKHYKSFDTVINFEKKMHYRKKFLKSLNTSRLQPHDMTLKTDLPIMQIKILSPPNMCNGMRILVKDLRDNLIVATILTGPAVGQLAHIPCIPMIPTD